MTVLQARPDWAKACRSLECTSCSPGETIDDITDRTNQRIGLRRALCNPHFSVFLPDAAHARHRAKGCTDTTTKLGFEWLSTDELGHADNHAPIISLGTVRADSAKLVIANLSVPLGLDLLIFRDRPNHIAVAHRVTITHGGWRNPCRCL